MNKILFCTVHMLCEVELIYDSDNYFFEVKNLFEWYSTKQIGKLSKYQVL